MIEETTIYTLKEVQAMLKISLRTAYTLFMSGRLSGFKLGGAWRTTGKDILNFIEANRPKSVNLD